MTMDRRLQPQWWTSQYQADERRRAYEAGQAAREPANSQHVMTAAEALAELERRKDPPS